MTTPDIERILDAWLGEGTDMLPNRSVEAVLRTVERTTQRAAWRVPWRTTPRIGASPLTVAASLAIVAVLTAGALTLWLAGDRQSIGVPAATQTPRPTVSPSQTSIAAPDLTGRIAFVRDGVDQDASTDIWVMNADGSRPTRLTTSPGPDEHPAWSRDATRIAFTVGDAASQVWVMNADGSNPRQVTHGDFPAGRPTWSPDGTQIAFAVNDAAVVDPGQRGLYVVNADGSGQRRITSDPGDGYPAWSPQGDRIAFVNGDAIYTVRPDGSARTMFAKHADGTSGVVIKAFRPAWSPDGTRIAVMIGDADGNSSIWLEDGRGETRLTGDDAPSADSPTWSPDGGWLSFVSFGNSDSYGDIYVIRADGSNLRDILPGPSKENAPTWSWR